VLRAAVGGRTGVGELAKELRVGPARLIVLLRDMKEQGLVEIGEVRSGRAGRPRIKVGATELGKAYLKAYGSLISIPLTSRRADLERAVEDADYATRLIAAGNSPYDLFLELNRIVKLPRSRSR